MSTDPTEETRLPTRVHATLDGWPVAIDLLIAPAKLGAALRRLGELGYTPAAPIAPVVPAPAPRRPERAPRVEPIYKPDGTPCCPVHLKDLTEGRYGLYCAAKARDGEERNEKGYCALRFTEPVA
jgi:hypothetical protein